MELIFGIVLFALGIGLSVALHEAGHMFTAKWFGMKVRRYFIGFGPKIFSFKRGETEYGLKAIPGGGFCDIAGMTAMDELTPDEEKRAMWRYPAWKRVVVMVAGSISHFILGFILLYILAASMGLPNLVDKPVIASTSCVQNDTLNQDPNTPRPQCSPSDRSPARDAGLQAGDLVVAVNGKDTKTFSDLRATLKPLSGPQQITVERDGQDRTFTVDVAVAQRLAQKGDQRVLDPQGSIGVFQERIFEYNAWNAVGGTVGFTGDMFVKTWEGLMRFPERLPAVVKAIGGGERDPDTPISVVGASRLGGEAIERGLWDLVLLLLASLNFFIGVFNLLPLLPLDGGHVAVIVYEKVRNAFRRMRGKPAGGPVDYTKLMGLTMVVVFIGGAVMLLTITADIVNPITLN
ncbi:membrane-associated protease RseP (regulator of RpoE activity) [Kibdelosporangium banguiense]|uniref:Membrane-associated protease RseP (Regulator of RpoE activity) n=1 Tax=Kibdelosporangium banguiense TaxID=1365924 RepID=A0ABS4THF1_9PSEU|nr:site-2 protease family protein [Kibdelosporangium banguiense]MBP2323851.1 membrane-associated protease RseP (regulator of RpoE activity) [Kibdelosporangium banguiense]